MSSAHEQIARWILESNSTVAFTGAGISTESGIPDFRSPGGVWATSQPVMFDEFCRSADARAEYWRQKSVSHGDFADAQPNAAHRALARWEALGKLRCVITQNIDGIHQLAGSSRVLELHGTARQVACLGCEFRDDAGPWVEAFLSNQHVPDCPKCGGLLKHATISFGQQLPPEVLETSAEWAQQCEVFLAMGSSLVVYPAAGLPELAHRSGARLVIVNRDPTPMDSLADAVINAGLGDTLEEIDRAMHAIGEA